MELFSQLVNAAVVVVVGLFVTHVIRGRARHQERLLAAHTGHQEQLLAAHIGHQEQLLAAHRGHQEQLLAAHIGAIGAQITALREVMDVRFAGSDKRFDSIDQQFASVRADLTQIALAVGAQPRPQAG